VDFVDVDVEQLESSVDRLQSAIIESTLKESPIFSFGDFCLLSPVVLAFVSCVGELILPGLVNADELLV
jgi:hypothetical protein